MQNFTHKGGVRTPRTPPSGTPLARGLSRRSGDPNLVDTAQSIYPIASHSRTARPMNSKPPWPVPLLPPNISSAAPAQLQPHRSVVLTRRPAGTYRSMAPEWGGAGESHGHLRCPSRRTTPAAAPVRCCHTVTGSLRRHCFTSLRRHWSCTLHVTRCDSESKHLWSLEVGITGRSANQNHRTHVVSQETRLNKHVSQPTGL